MKTAMQELKNRLQGVVDRLTDAEHGTDQYGYRSAMEKVIKDIDEQMLEKEKQQITTAWNDHRYNKWGNENTIVDGEHYYNEKFNKEPDVQVSDTTMFN